MRNIILLSVSIFGFSTYLTAQTLSKFQKRDESNNVRFGLKNRQGSVVVPATYDMMNESNNHFIGRTAQVYQYVLIDSTGMILTKEPYNQLWFPKGDRSREGLILARKGSRFGFLSWTGKVVVPFDFEDAFVFNDGMAPAKKNGKYGVINASGKPMIPYEYEKVRELGDKYYFAVKNGKSHLLNSSGQTLLTTVLYDLIFPPTEDFMVVKKNEKYGVIGMDGKEILPLTFSSAYVLSSLFFYAEDGTNQFGYTSTGKLLFKRKYEGHQTSSFQHPIAFKEGGLWGFYDKWGKVAIPPQFSEYKPVTFRYIRVKKGDSYGVLGADGTFLVPAKYEVLEIDQTGLNVCLVKSAGYYGLLNTYGKAITSEKYTFIGLSDITISEQLELNDLLGPYKIPNPLDFAALPDDLKYEYLDETQDYLERLKKEYSDYLLGREGMFPTLLWGKWGFLDGEGKVAVPFEYDLVTHFKNGRAEVLKGKNRFYIDKSGKKL